MDATNEAQLVCAPSAYGEAETSMPIPSGGGDTAVLLTVDVFPFGIFVELDFFSFPEGGDSLMLWQTTDSSGSNEITLTMGSTSKNLVGDYFGSGLPVPTATGTMNAVEWWSYDGLYSTSTGELL